MGTVLLFLSPDLVSFVLEETWMPMVPAFSVLCIAGTLRAINACWGALFHAAGLPKVLARVSLLQLLLVACVLPPLTMKLGIVGAALSILAGHTLCFGLAAREGLRILGAAWPEFVRSLGPGLLCAAACLAGVVVIGLVLRDSTNPAATLVTQCVVAISIALGLASRSSMFREALGTRAG
jgi:O-antigen/teichoic acid export membrane protein